MTIILWGFFDGIIEANKNYFWDFMTCTDKETNLWAFHTFHTNDANKNWVHICVKFLIDVQIFNGL